MTQDGAGSSETAALREQIAKLENDLLETRTVLSECVLTTLTVALVAQRIGREHPALFKRNTLVPDVPSPLEALDERLHSLIGRFEETVGGD